MHTSLLSLAAFATLTALGGSVAAQRTWIVDLDQRAGWNFTAIQPAVDAAAPGDLVLVRAASGPYDGATIPKGLRLVGEGLPELRSELFVTGIPAGAQVTVQHFRTIDTRMSVVGGRGIDCSASAGTIHLEDVHAAGSDQGPGLRIRGCRLVSALDCELDAGASWIFSPFTIRPIAGDVGIACDDSALLLVRCKARGLDAAVSPTNPVLAPLDSEPGLRATRSRVVTVDCEVSGGDGLYTTLPFFCIEAPPPEPAAYLTASTLVTKATSYTGGSVAPTVSCPARTAEGVAADAKSRVVRDPGVSFSVTGTAATVRGLADLQGAGVPVGSPLSLTLRAAAPASYATFGSFPFPPVLPDVGLWLQQPQAVQLFAGSVNGTQTDVVGVPPTFPPGLGAGFQSVLLVGGQLELSTPVVVVLDP